MQFTPDNARMFAERGNAARAEKRRVAAESLEGPGAAREPLKVACGDAYRGRKLACVRAQWDRLDVVLDALIDRAAQGADGLNPQALDRVTAAIGRLEEVERRLSDRSTPPSLRAGAPQRLESPLMD